MEASKHPSLHQAMHRWYMYAEIPPHRQSSRTATGCEGLQLKCLFWQQGFWYSFCFDNNICTRFTYSCWFSCWSFQLNRGQLPTGFTDTPNLPIYLTLWKQSITRKRIALLFLSPSGAQLFYTDNMCQPLLASGIQLMNGWRQNENNL